MTNAVERFTAVLDKALNDAFFGWFDPENHAWPIWEDGWPEVQRHVSTMVLWPAVEDLGFDGPNLRVDCFTRLEEIEAFPRDLLFDTRTDYPNQNQISVRYASNTGGEERRGVIDYSQTDYAYAFQTMGGTVAGKIYVMAKGKTIEGPVLLLPKKVADHERWHVQQQLEKDIWEDGWSAKRAMSVLLRLGAIARWKKECWGEGRTSPARMAWPRFSGEEEEAQMLIDSEVAMIVLAERRAMEEAAR